MGLRQDTCISECRLLSIRNATFSDIPAIVGLLQSGFERSHYANNPHGAGIDHAEAKRLLVQAIQRHGNKHGGATWVQVAETDGIVSGLILGTLARVYAIGTHLMASDLFWVTHPMSSPRDAANLMRSFIEWAKSCPHVIEIKCGTTAIINEDPAEAGKILERLGMKPYGNLYRMEVEA